MLSPQYILRSKTIYLFNTNQTKIDFMNYIKQIKVNVI